MSIGPVIIRELRAEAQHSSNHWLRVSGAAGLLAAIGLATVKSDDPAQILFGYVNATVLGSICVLVPALAADCISRERREGTLGLLFLTPLTSFGIVAGKSFVHGLRAMTLFLTMLPVLAVPILAGGVSSKDFLMAVMIDAGALVLALAAGILASACCRERLKAIALAELWNVLFLNLYLTWHMKIWGQLAFPSNPEEADCWGDVFTGRTTLKSALGALFSFGVNLEKDSWPSDSTWWASIWARSPVSEQHAWLWSAAKTMGGTIAFLLTVMLVASYGMEHSWKDSPQTARRQRLRQFFCHPRFRQEAHRLSLRLLLERNPIGWLHFHSCGARMIKWTWLLSVIILQCALVATAYDGPFTQMLVLSIVLVGMALNAASSFRKDRESGALELLVVTPLRQRDLIGGRLLAIWGQFAPTLAGLVIIWFVTGQLFFVIPAVSTFLTLPVIGLFFSLHRLRLEVAWLCTIACSLLLPCLAFWLGALSPEELDTWTILSYVATEQLIVAGIAGGALAFKLRTRRFVLG